VVAPGAPGIAGTVGDGVKSAGAQAAARSKQDKQITFHIGMIIAAPKRYLKLYNLKLTGPIGWLTIELPRSEACEVAIQDAESKQGGFESFF
jgi:hypothetical protein